MDQRPIYHITHCDNLPGIISAGVLWSDAQRRQQGFQCTNVGYSHIKERRMRRTVTRRPVTTLGQYVPFNFCSRSIMLYVLHRGHDDYRGGQDLVVHLVSTVGQARRCGQNWAFTDRHADLAYARYYNDLAHESEVQWNVMEQRMWGGDGEVKERRQAEFLVFDSFPWTAINEIGVKDRQAQNRVVGILNNLAPSHRPLVTIHSDWYY